MKCNINNRVRKSTRGFIREVVASNGATSLLYDRLVQSDTSSLSPKLIQDSIDMGLISHDSNQNRALLLYLSVEDKSVMYPLDKNGEPLVKYEEGRFVPDIADKYFTTFTDYKHSHVLQEAENLRSIIEDKELEVESRAFDSLLELLNVFQPQIVYNDDIPSYYHSNVLSINLRQVIQEGLRVGQDKEHALIGFIQTMILKEHNRAQGKGSTSLLSTTLQYESKNNVDLTLSRVQQSSVRKYENTLQAIMEESTLLKEDLNLSGYDFSNALPFRKEGATKEQLEAYDKMMVRHTKVNLDNDHNYTVTGLEQKTAYGTNEYLNMVNGPNDEVEFYGQVDNSFSGADTKYTIWGTQVDTVMNSIFENNSLQKVKQDLLQSDNVSKHGLKLNIELVETLYNQYRPWFEKKESEGSRFVVQVKNYYEFDDVIIAGTRDIVEILPDGSMRIYDVKTSMYPFTKPYTSDAGYTNSFDKGFTMTDPTTGKRIKKASKREKYSALLTMYAQADLNSGQRLAESNPISIIPIHLSEIDNAEVVQGVTFETELEPLRISINNNISERLFANSLELEGSKVGHSELNTMMNNVAEMLMKRVLLIDRNPNKNKVKQTKDKVMLYKLGEALREVNDVQQLAKFTETLTDQLLGYSFVNGNTEVTWPGHISLISKDLKSVKKGKDSNGKLLSHHDSSAMLADHVQAIDMFTPMIRDLRTLLNRYNEFNLEGKDNIGDTALSRAMEALDKFTILKDELTKVQIDYHSKFIARGEKQRQSNPEVQNTLRNIDSKIKEVKDKLKNTELTAKRKKSLEKELLLYSKRRKAVGGMETDGTIEDHVKNILSYGSTIDISVVDALFTPAIMSSNTLVSLFAKKLKQRFEEARHQSMSTLNLAKKAYEEYNPRDRDNPHTENEPFLTTLKKYNFRTDTYDESVHFRTEDNMNMFEEEKVAYYQKIDREHDDSNKKRELRNKWYFDNTTSLIKDRTVTNPYTGEVVVVREGVETILKKRYEELKAEHGKRKVKDNSGKYVLKSKLEYEKFIHQNKLKNGQWKFRATRVPKKKYRQSLNLTDRQLKYRNFLMATYFKDQQSIPREKRLYTQLPSIVKNNNDRWRELGLDSKHKYFKYQYESIMNDLDARDEETFRVTDNSEVEEGERMKNTNNLFVPVLYSNKRIDANDVSKDIMTSVLRYNGMVNKYNARMDMKPVADFVVQQSKENPPRARDSKGNKIVDAFAKKVGFTKHQEQYWLKSDENQVHKLLKTFVEMQVYGVMTKESNLFSPRQQKLISSIMGFQAFTQLGIFKPLTTVANALTASTSATIEAYAGKHVTVKSWRQALVHYGKSEREHINSFGSFTADTKYKMLIDMYDPIQGDFSDKLGRKETQSTMKRAWSTDTWFYAMHKGEHLAQVRLMYAMMLDKKVSKKDGSDEMSFLDAVEHDSKTNTLSLKEGYGYMNSNNVFTTDVYDFSLQNKLHGINKQLHGVYNKFDRTAIEQNTIGQMLMMYRKFLPSGMKKRWRGVFKSEPLQYNVETEDHEIGDYVALLNFTKHALKDFKNLKNLMYSKTSILTTQELYGAKRATIELGFILLLTMAVIALKNLDDDDEKNSKAYYRTLYYTMRLNAELSSFINPVALFKSIRSPTAAYSTVEKIVRLGMQMFEPFEEYEQKTGLADTGDNKALYKFFKIWGLSGHWQDPQEAVKILDLSL